MFKLVRLEVLPNKSEQPISLKKLSENTIRDLREESILICKFLVT